MISNKWDYPKRMLFVLITFLTNHAQAADYYWVGGSGSWSDLTHWATSSGGSTYHSQVPTFKDNVYFDGNSFPKTGEEVLLNVSNAVCNDFVWDNVNNFPKFSSSDKSYSIRIYGSFQLDKNMDFAYSGYFTFEAITKGHTIKTANFNIQKFEFLGLTGEWTLQDSLKIYGDANGYGIVLAAGHLISNNQVIQTTSFISEANNWRKLSLGKSQVNLIDRELGWQVTGKNFHLNAGTSTINLLYKSWRKQFRHTATNPKNVFYNLVDHYRYPKDYVGDYYWIVDSTSFNKIEIKSTINRAEFNGINIKNLICHERIDMLLLNKAKIGKLDLKNSSYVDGSFQVDTLALRGGATYEFAADNIIDVRKAIDWKGACGSFVCIKSSNPGTEINFDVNTPTAQNISYCKLQHVLFTGTASVIASNLINSGTATGLASKTNYNTTVFYWVGGRGEWSDANHWSLTSGGSGQACIPGPSDSVVFDKNSFSSTLDTLFLNLRENMCGSITYKANAISAIFHSRDSQTLRTFGNILFYGKPQNAMKGRWMINNYGPMDSLRSSNFEFTRLEIACESANSGVILCDSLRVAGFNDMTNNEALTLSSGVLETRGNPLNTRRFSSYGTRKRELKLDTSNWYMRDAWEPAWYIEGNNFKLDSTDYHIQIFRTDWKKVFYHFSRFPYIKYNKISFQDLVQNPRGTDIVRINDSCGIGELNLRSYVGELSINNTVVNRLNCYEKVINQNSSNSRIGSARYHKGAVMHGNANFDTLIFYPGATVQFQKGRTQTIDSFLGIKGDCQGLISISSTESNEITKIDYKQDSAQGDYLALKDIEGIGTAIYLAKNASDRGGNINWDISLLKGTTYYWVQDSGRWSDPNHWSLTSGGSPSGCIPSQLDDVVFDGNSFTKSGEIVYIDLENASCNSMNWDFTVRPAILKGPYTSRLRIFGDLRFRPNLDYKFEGFVQLEATDTGNFIFPYFKPIVRLDITGTGSWRLFDSLQVTGDRDQNGIVFTSGTFISQGNYIKTRKFTSLGDAYKHWDMTGSWVEAYDPPDWGWDVSGRNFYLTATNSHLAIRRNHWRKAFSHMSPYPRVKFDKISFLDKSSNPNGTDYFRATDSLQVNELTFESYVQELFLPHAQIGKLMAKEKIYGQYSDANSDRNNRSPNKSTYIRYAKYENECDFFGFMYFDTLKLNPGGIYKFETQKSYSVNKLFDAVGNSCFPITLQSSTVNKVDTLKFFTGTTSLIDFVEMRDQYALSPTIQKIGSNSIDVSGNENWIFENTSKQNLGIGPDTVLCMGDSIILNTNFYKGAFGYLWSDSSTKSTLKVKKSGNYWVKVLFTYRGDTCWKYDTCQVTFTPLKLNIATYDATCASSSDGKAKATYNGLHPLKSWSWSTGGTTDSVSNLKSGIHFITATDSKGCKRTDTVLINHGNFTPKPTPIDTNYCAISDNIFRLFNRDSANYSADWFDSSKSILTSNQNSYQFKDQIGDSIWGYYAFNNKNGCTGPLVPFIIRGIHIGDSTDIQVYDARCLNSKDGKLSISYTGLRKIDRYDWSNNQPGDSLSSLAPGSYSVRIIGSDGCISIDSAIVGYENIQAPESLDTIICENSEITLFVNRVLNYSVKWFDINGIELDTGISYKLIANKDSIEVFAQFQSPTGCVSSLSKMLVRSRPLPGSPVVNRTINLCLNQPYSFDVSGTNIRWYTSKLDSIGTSLAPTPRVDTLLKQVFYLTDNDGFCTSLKDSIVATVNTHGVSVSKDSSIYKGEAIFLMASGAQSYVWRPFIGLSDSTGEIVLANPSQSVCYVIYGTSSNGCTGTDTVCLTVMDPYSITLPNIISPDGDDLNDVWRIDMLPEWSKYEVTIMDRQGAIVFKRSPYDNSFNATDFNGVPLPNGVYYYYLRHLEEDIKFKGYIQVIR